MALIRGCKEEEEEEEESIPEVSNDPQLWLHLPSSFPNSLCCASCVCVKNPRQLLSPLHVVSWKLELLVFSLRLLLAYCPLKCRGYLPGVAFPILLSRLALHTRTAR